MSTTAPDGLIERALAEDVGDGDITTLAIVPEELRGAASLVMREPGVVCGVDEAFAVFRALDPDAELERMWGEGDELTEAPAEIAVVCGRLRALLTGERTALNLLQRSCGIATQTRAYADRIDGTDVQLLDTRKTAPGLRELDKKAVACGGGTNHRAGLYDAILIKDNHVAVAGGVAAAIAATRASRPGEAVEVEVDTLQQLDEALASGAEAILLDNMPPATLREAVGRTAGRARLEASGGIMLDTIRDVAETGVDAISVGALTHSVRALDIAMEVTPSHS
jgi:nicotinate-nucleotide pyrophosphorylase (carboxylating)